MYYITVIIQARLGRSVPDRCMPRGLAGEIIIFHVLESGEFRGGHRVEVIAWRSIPRNLEMVLVDAFGASVVSRRRCMQAGRAGILDKGFSLS